MTRLNFLFYCNHQVYLKFHDFFADFTRYFQRECSVILIQCIAKFRLKAR